MINVLPRNARQFTFQLLAVFLIAFVIMMSPGITFAQVAPEEDPAAEIIAPEEAPVSDPEIVEEEAPAEEVFEDTPIDEEVPTVEEDPIAEEEIPVVEETTPTKETTEDLLEVSPVAEEVPVVEKTAAASLGDDYGFCETDIVQNGSFEETDDRLGVVHGKALNALAGWDMFTTLPFWFTDYDTAGIEVHFKNIVTSPSDGDYKLELDSHGADSNSAMSQEIEFIVDGDYQIRFDYRARTKKPTDNDILVKFDDVIIDTISSVDTSAWQEIIVNMFDVSAGDHKLTLQASGLDNSLGAFIDNVRMVRAAEADYDPSCDVLADIEPNQAPELTITGGINSFVITAGDVFELPTVTAHDDRDGDLTADIIVGGDTLDTETPGVYEMTYAVTDSLGATSEVLITVSVEEVPVAAPAPSTSGRVTSSSFSSGRSSGGGSIGPSVLGAETVAEEFACQQFTQYLDRGDEDGKNGITEVSMLQGFLNSHLGLDMPVDGMFGPVTEKGIHALQQKYFTDIIGPWTSVYPARTTGRFLNTTRSFVNKMLECPEEPVFLQEVGTWYSITDAGSVLNN